MTDHHRHGRNPLPPSGASRGNRKWFSATLALLLAAPLAAEWSDPSAHRSGFVTANGVRLHYLDWGGAGPASLILIHGLGDNPHVFDDLAPAFTSRFRVIAYARRGHGQSEARGPYDSATLANDLRGLMDALGIAKANLAGHSMGGNEITAMAALYPARTERIVYLDAAYDWGDPAFAPAYEAWPPIFMNPPPSVADSLDAWRAYKMTYVFPEFKGANESSRFEAYIRGLVRVQPDGTLRSVMSESVARDLLAAVTAERRDYAKVHCPALAIYAETSFDVHHGDAAQLAVNLAWEQKYMAPFRTASIERIRRELPGVEILNLPGAHMGFLFSSRQKLVSAIRRFLTGTPPP